MQFPFLFSVSEVLLSIVCLVEVPKKKKKTIDQTPVFSVNDFAWDVR